MPKLMNFYETRVTPCPYLDNKQSASIILDTQYPIDTSLFSSLSEQGFRRSGGNMYIPHCPQCCECISVRIPVKSFSMRSNQKRAYKKNQDLTMNIDKMRFSLKDFSLYCQYQQARHPKSNMCNEDPAEYINFLCSNFANTQRISFQLNEDLLAVSVIDELSNGLSAVYTFFDQNHAKRSLGIYAILRIIDIAKQCNLPYVYLGYWVKNSPKMQYKKQFMPIEGYINKKWVTL